MLYTLSIPKTMLHIWAPYYGYHEYVPELVLKEEISGWLKQQGFKFHLSFCYRDSVDHGFIHFYSESDLMFFLLRWGEGDCLV